jgi:hypothetical protein
LGAVAVGLQRAHAKLVGQGQGLLVVRSGGRDIRWVTVHGDLTEQPQGLCFLAPTFALASVTETALGQSVRLLHTPGEEIRLPADDGAPPKLPQHSEGVCRSASHSVCQRQMRGR